MLPIELAIFLSPGAGRQLVGLALLVCGGGLVLFHLVIIHKRYEKLNEVLPPEEQFDPVHMKRDTWRFDRVFRNRFPADWSLAWEIMCLVGGSLIAFIGLNLLLPDLFKFG